MFCSKCGKQISEGANFCENCGARVNAQPVTQQPPDQGPQQGQYTYQQPQPKQRQYTYQPPQHQRPKKKLPIVPILLAVVVIGGALFAVPRLKALFGIGGSGQTTAKPSATQGGSLLDLSGGSSGGKDSLGGSTSGKTAADYSTDILPTDADFQWFYNEFLGSGEDVPKGAAYISEPTLLNGGWKVIIYRRPKSDDNWRKEYQHFDLTLNDDGTVEADVKWSGYQEAGKDFEDAQNASPDHFTGTWERANGEVHITMEDFYGIGVELVCFYEYQGGQYAYGAYYPYNAEEEMGFAGFSRP